MDHKIIFTKNGDRILVDIENYNFLNQWKWHLTKDNHVIRDCRIKGKRIVYSIHRLIIKVKKGQFVDHINRNPLDNRKCNLRICTQSQNSMNKAKVQGFSSKYKGVSWTNTYKKWRVYIISKSKRYYLGLFDSEIEAAKTYDKAAKKLHKEFAVLNLNYGS